MKLFTFPFKTIALLGMVFFLANCEEGLDPVELRQDPVLPDSEECLIFCEEEPGYENSVVIDFAEFSEFDLITESKGVGVRAYEPFSLDPLEVRVFDTDTPSACAAVSDPDLVFPGGPYGNVAIIQQENRNCPDDRRDGGVIEFTFLDSYPGGVTINCLDLLDTEEFGQIDGQGVNGAIILFGVDGIQIGSLIPVPAVEDGEAQVLPIGQSNVGSMLFFALGSGAISNICFTPAPPQQEEGECANNGLLLDFEEFGENEEITMSSGVTITGAITPAITFDTEDPDMCPKFDDTDMILTGEGFGNILVNQHRSKVDCANADPRGGTLTFEFPNVSTINSMDFFDTEEDGSTVTFYGPGDVMLATADIPVVGDGEWQNVAPGLSGVVKFVIDFAGSGGVDNVCYTPEPQ